MIHRPRLFAPTNQLINWIFDNPEKAVLPSEIKSSVERARNRYLFGPDPHPRLIISNVLIDHAISAALSLFLGYTQKSVARLRSSVVYALKSIDCVRFGEPTETAALDYSNCLNEASRLWRQEVKNVLAFNIPQGRKPFV